MSPENDHSHIYCTVRSDWGRIVLQYNLNRLHNIAPLFFADVVTYGTELTPDDNLADALLPNPKPICDWLNAFFSPNSLRSISQKAVLNQPIQSLLPIELFVNRFTSFQCAVLKAISEIPIGSTSTYMQIAELINSKAARAVGTVMARNPFPIIYPCHRVLGAGDRIGGFAGGLKNKMRLLDWEQRAGALI